MLQRRPGPEGHRSPFRRLLGGRQNQAGDGKCARPPEFVFLDGRSLGRYGGHCVSSA